ncbi:O-antigen ligase family protein [Tautonia plasticadhaerens]|uniref:O-Antigen ligase n=1 Tax=Tautonia plasticadhaerens TaxID=2527974 RepID=A0A518GZ01_9BACT|nr:O-antigen ligase domain-containing protein [Tautonia plasticadhaerens]QDV33815.1 O-Antigen ligase [Tautonia plasticadhaerens]
MGTFRTRILEWTDRLQAALLVAMLVGSALAFGGAVWWWRPVAAALAVGLVVLGFSRVAIEGRARIRLSPLPILGVLALGLAAAQLTPVPSGLARRLSPESRSLHSRGILTGLALQDDRAAELPEALASRTPTTVDRSATLRWLFDASIGLVVLVTSARFARRLGRTMVIWGSVVAVFGLMTGVGLVQLIGDAPGLWGFITPGRGPSWAPSTLDLLAAPGASVLRPLAEEGGALGPWMLARPDRPFFIGGLLGGPGAYLAIAALGLPLSLTVLLQVLAPRGSREPMAERIGRAGLGPLVVLLGVVVLVGAGLVGALAGPMLAVPFALGLALAGVPGARGTGLGWLAVGVTLLGLTGLGTGVAIHRLAGLGDDPKLSPITAEPGRAADLWRGSVEVVKDFPLLGTGLGTFGRIHPSYKSTDPSPTTAGSSVLQWLVESGMAGGAILAVAGLWGLGRLVRAWRRVGSADRALACGLVATAGCFVGFAAVHWAVELPAVALAACAVFGTMDRWLSGGTDLFVEAA